MGGGLNSILVIPIHYGGGIGVCLLSSFLLFRTRYVRDLMAFWCILFMRVLMLVFRLVNLSMECSCMAPLTSIVMVMRCRVLINGSYFMCLRMRACSGNLS